MTKFKPFIFIGDLLESTDGKTSYNIIHNYYFKKANAEQIKLIRNVNKLSDEFLLRFDHTHNSSNNQLIPIENIEDYNYWIVEHENNQADHDISLALMLSDLGPYSLFEKLSNSGISWTQYSLQVFIQENFVTFKKKPFSQSDINQTRDIFISIKKFNENLNDNYVFIEKSLNDYRDLRMLPKRSPFYTLGIFSMLESLLSNNSKNTNSITHQLKKKLTLINNQIEQKIDVTPYFGEQKFETVIAKLYTYRSDIAHGNFSDFGSELRILGNSDNVNEFLLQVLKIVIIYAINNPRLITDLKYI